MRISCLFIILSHFKSIYLFNMDVVFDKVFIVDQILNHGQSLIDCIGTLKSGAYVYQLNENYAILSPNTIEYGGKGYLIFGKEDFERMYKDESFPQIFNGREDIFEINREVLEDKNKFALDLHSKYPEFFQEDPTTVDQLCSDLCRNIWIEAKNMNNREFFEKVILLIEVFRQRNDYSWHYRKVYGEYTYYYLPVLRDKDKELGADIIASSMFDGKTWESIHKEFKMSLTLVNWYKK